MFAIVYVNRAVQACPWGGPQTVTHGQRVELLVDSAGFDIATPTPVPPMGPSICPSPSGVVYPARAAGGCLPLFKVLMTNECRNDCHYCANRSSANIRRVSLPPEELVSTFLGLVRSGQVQGLFLSSGVCDTAERTQERMLQAVEALRRKHHYAGYIHLKLLPGVSDACIQAASRLADRVSTNLEAPSVARLARIAPDKAFRDELLAPLTKAAGLVRPNVLRSGLTTQFVVGGAGESDEEILTATEWLYRNLRLRRTYYSAFRPLEGTPLDGLPPAPPLREHRLYQADFLLRDYGVSLSELVFDPDGRLPMDRDPKLALALASADAYPVELNTASREQLLRVPGLGPVAVERILGYRRERTIRDSQQLAGLGVRRQTLGFVTLNGRLGGTGQLSLALS